MRKSLGRAMAVVILLAVVWLGWRIVKPPAVGSSIPLAQLPAPEQERRRAEAKALTDQVKDIAGSARQNEKKPFAMTATEDQLNTLVQDNMKGGHLTVTDPHIGLEPDVLALQGRVNYNGLNVVATVRGPLLAQEGKLAYQVDSLQLGGLPAPSNLKLKVQDLVTKNLNEIIFKKAPVTVQKVTLEQGKLTVSGVTH